MIGAGAFLRFRYWPDWPSYWRPISLEVVSGAQSIPTLGCAGGGWPPDCLSCSVAREASNPKDKFHVLPEYDVSVKYFKGARMVRFAVGMIFLFVFITFYAIYNPNIIKWLSDHEKLAGWGQAWIASFAIVLAIWSIFIPGRQSKKDAADKKRKNASMFIAKYQMTIARDLSRINGVISDFEKISLDPKGNYQSFINLVRAFCNMQISDISDYEWAYDFSPRMLKIVAEAQSHREVGHRGLERSMEGVSVVRDGEYVQKIIDKSSDFLTDYWFRYDDEGRFTMTGDGSSFKKNLLQLKELISSANEISKDSVIR